MQRSKRSFEKNGCPTLVARLGVPDIITSDRGAHFTWGLWRAICSTLNISYQQTTSYHPQSNLLVERSNSASRMFYVPGQRPQTGQPRSHGC